MVCKALLWTDVFWISYINWYEFYNINLLVVLGSKQGGTLKLVNLKLAGWASIQLLTLSLTFLVCFTEMSSHFSIKTNKRKVRKYPKYMMEFSFRFDLANGKCLSNFLGIFCNYRTLHRDCYLTSRKRKKKILWKIVLSSFQFSKQKNQTWKSNTFWCGIFRKKKKNNAGGLRWTNY